MLWYAPMAGKKVILIISDSHIPERAYEIDEHIVNFIKSKVYDVVIHAGDLTDEQILDQVKSFGLRCYVVQGNMDYLDLPEKESFEIYGIHIGVVHGDQVRPRGNIKALTAIAKEMNVEILISGHTHSSFIVLDPAGVVHINPGSVTGVWGGGGGSMIPSFIEMEVYENRIVKVRLYELNGNSVVLRKEEKFTFA